ncbi:MAG: TatD family hydrolase [Armatimonadetes bacterium]|nr:TatD family hydrolase [Armatimonadota bacterium]
MEIFDTHCHLNLPEAFSDPKAAIEEAREAGVTRFVVVGIDGPSSVRAVELAERFEGVYSAVGWHPNSAATWGPEARGLVEELLNHPRTVALGEIGLDYHWDFATPEQQSVCLVDQLDMAKDAGKPVVFHCRNAYDDLLRVLEDRPGQPYLFHCFSGTDEHAERCLAMDALFGFDGPLTYRNSEGLRELFARLPETTLVLETDSPYLSPEPLRGKPNRPAYLRYVNQTAAHVRALPPEKMAAITTSNAMRFFGI